MQTVHHARGSSLPLLLVLAALLAGGVLWFLLHDSADTETESLDAYLGDGTPTSSEEEASNGPAPEAQSQPAATESARGLPRVLPPDAAVEDVRDALALSGEAREEELTRAYDAIGKLATEGGRVIEGIRKYAQSVEDERVRGVVIAALGTQEAKVHQAWLRERLEKAPTMAERIGALIALAQPHTKKERAASKEAKATMLGGLRYRYVALPTNPLLMMATRTILQTTNQGEAEDSFLIVVASVKQHRKWADLLVAKNELRPWLQSQPPSARLFVIEAALKHRDLHASARRVLEEAR